MGNFFAGALGGSILSKKDKSKSKWKERASMYKKEAEANKLGRKSLLESDLVGQDVMSQNTINQYLDRKTGLQ